jgi:ribonuclease III
MGMFEQLEGILGYSFRNRELLAEALTHPSAVLEKNGRRISYERLEFLGDAVLLCVVARYLFEAHREETEGELSRRKAYLVSSPTLARVAEQMHLGDHMSLGHGEESGGGRRNPHNLENLLEAVIGAIFMDSGFEAARIFILSIWIKLDEENLHAPSDPKTELQEWTQRHFKSLPEYTLLPSDCGDFHLRLSVPGQRSLECHGNSIRATKKELAERMLKNIRDGGRETETNTPY